MPDGRCVARTAPRPLRHPVAHVLAVMLVVTGCADPVGPRPRPASPTADAAPSVAASADIVRVVTFGDSNTDAGYAGRDPVARVRSYVSTAPLRLAPGAANSPLQLAGKIELRWRALRADSIRVVNHGITATTSGGGGHGGSSRTSNGSPNARTLVNSVSRFRAEVMGVNAPGWHGGEAVRSSYPQGRVYRVNAYRPDAVSFAYVSMGTNDLQQGFITDTTKRNLAWMIGQWTSAGLPASHFIITTLAPISSSSYASRVPILNTKLRKLADSTGVKLIDLAAHTSNDNGRTWKSSTLHVGDRLHYAEPVREWLAEQVVAHIATLRPAPLVTAR